MDGQYVIAIDGPTASGKGTVAKMLAKNLGISCLDTGALYRSIGIHFLDNKIDANDPNAVAKAMSEISLDVNNINGETHVVKNGVDLTPRLYDLTVSSFTPSVARIPEVRESVRKIQRAIAREKSIIIEGRDVTSVVFPNARFKFYLDAKLEARSDRRHKQELSKGVNVTYDQVKQYISDRDHADMTRETSPLVHVKDAIKVDATTKSALEIVAEMESIIRKQLKIDEKQEAKKAASEKKILKKNGGEYVHPDFRKPYGALGFRIFCKMAFYVPWHIFYFQKVINRRELKQHRGKPVIFALQHRSNADVAAIFLAFHGFKLHFLGKESLFKPHTILNWGLRCLDGVPIRPGNDLAVIRYSLGVLKKNEALAIFPEGRRNFNSEDALAVRNGTAVIAMKSGAPVVPIVTNRSPRPLRVNAFKVGTTIWPEKCADKNDLSAKLKESMTQLLVGFEKLPKRKKWEKQPIHRARGIVIVDGKLLVIKRFKEGQNYYVFPGGFLEKNETARDAVVRELREECNIEVAVTRELYRNFNMSLPEVSRNEAYFLCEKKSGTISKTETADEYQPGAEVKIVEGGKKWGTFEPMLIDLSELPNIDLRPSYISLQLQKDINKYGNHLTRTTKYVK